MPGAVPIFAVSVLFASITLRDQFGRNHGPLRKYAIDGAAHEPVTESMAFQCVIV